MIAGALFSFLFVGAMIVGVQLEAFGDVEFKNIKRALALLVLAFAAAPYVTVAMEKLAGGMADTGKRTERKSFLRIWAALVLVYTVVLLACWPGNFNYDAWTEHNMVASGAYSQHHPLAHVLLLGGTVQAIYNITGSYNLGIELYTIVQMLVVSACLAYMLYTLAGFGVKKWVYALCFAIIALFPTVQLFVICSAKDVLFSAGAVLFMTLLLEMIRSPEMFWQQSSKKVLFVCASLLIVLMRNNGVYAYAVFMALFAWVYRRQWRRWLALLLAVAAVYIGVNKGVAAVLQATPANHGLMLCVPLQQLARVYSEEPDTYTEEERARLLTFIDEQKLAAYLPKLADPVTFAFPDETFCADPWAFWRLWAKTGLRQPGIYLEAFLMNTYQYWYIDTFPDGYVGTVAAYPESNYFGIHVEGPGLRDSLIPSLEALYVKIAREIFIQKIPVIAPLFEIGLWHWVWAFAMMYLAARRKWKQVFTLLLPALTYGTMLLGPIVLVRYVLYLLFGMPIVLAYIFDADAVSGTGSTAGKP